MPTDGRIGYGIQLAANGTVIGQVTDCKPISAKIPSAQITSQDASADGEGVWHEKIFKIGDAGQLTFTCIASPEVRAQVWALRFTYPAWTITFPQGGAWSFTGFLAGVDDTDPIDDPQSLDLSIEITGTPTYA
jgi:hypothetical protein